MINRIKAFLDPPAPARDPVGFYKSFLFKSAFRKETFDVRVLIATRRAWRMMPESREPHWFVNRYGSLVLAVRLIEKDVPC